MMLSNRMTENNLLATAAAAIVHRIMRRRRPLVFLPLSPSKKNLAPGMSASTAAIVKKEWMNGGAMGSTLSGMLRAVLERTT